jgi:NADPH:quinone reductase-like Zn-dependent oxidoreductase
MKAIAITGPGASPALVDLPAPGPAEGEVLARARGSSVNGFDLSVAHGRKRLMIGLPGDRLPSADEVATAAAATTIVRFDLDGGRTPSEAGTGEQTATSKDRQ